jgi:site-specific DNA-methyltransferase (cytosine-N4-specific)
VRQLVVRVKPRHDDDGIVGRRRASEKIVPGSARITCRESADQLDSYSLTVMGSRRSSRAGRAAVRSLFSVERDNPRSLLHGHRPIYTTRAGAMFCGDSRSLLSAMPDQSVDLVVTSPPYALHFKKAYGNVDKGEYVDWFRGFGEQILRVLKPSGSFVLNIGGSFNAGTPTRSLYHFRVLLMLCDELGFKLAQECFWFNPAKMPTPAEWVNVRRIRIKDSVEYVFWLSKTDEPKADNRNVLVPYSADMLRLIRKGYRAKERPSGYKITDKWGQHRGGAIPPNVIDTRSEIADNLIERGNNESNSSYIRRTTNAGQKVHPARFPAALPEFFIRFLTSEDDLVVDPFAGSNMTGAVAEHLGRRWLGFELQQAYAENARLRFDDHR